MAKHSAGLLAYRIREGALEVFLVHPGGPFWKNKDAGAWSIPKGEIGPGENAEAAARREFAEETGIAVEDEPAGGLLPLIPIRQPAGKTVYAWALRQEIDPTAVRSNLFELEWPPRSGKRQSFPEIDRAEWFSLEQALVKIQKGQDSLLRQLAKVLQG
jgi:predicted NUDIX family NTP pyrophosphohydrolase